MPRRTHPAVTTGLLAALLTLAGSVRADEPWDEDPPEGLRIGESLLLIPSGQYRPRLLLHGGRDLAPGNNVDAVAQRARLGLEVHTGPWLRFQFQVQDVRQWGEETSTLDYAADGFDLHQAWIEGRTPCGHLALRVGRQIIALDNQRLIGAVDWSNQGRVFDAALARFHEPGLLDVKAFYAKIGERDALVLGSDQTGQPVVLRGARQDENLAALWARLTRFEWLRPSLVAIYDGGGTTDRHRVTTGLYLDGSPLRGLSYQAEAYLQLGRQDEPAGRKDIFALLGALRLSYQAPLPLMPGFSAWVDYLSGDDDAGDGTVRTFDTLFATNHKFYGYMDFFTNLPLHTAGLGLMDIGGRIQWGAPQTGFSAWFDVHHFRLAEEHPAGVSTVGQELDLLLNYRFNRFLTLQAVLAAFLPDDAAAQLRGGGDDTELYGYLQTDLHF